MNKGDEARIEEFEMWCFRRITRNSWMDKVRIRVVENITEQKIFLRQYKGEDCQNLDTF